MYLLIDGNIQEITGVPEIYFMGQGGLMDIELHPKFKENNILVLSNPKLHLYKLCFFVSWSTYSVT